MEKEKNNKMEQNSKENEVTKNEVAEWEMETINATSAMTVETEETLPLGVRIEMFDASNYLSLTSIDPSGNDLPYKVLGYYMGSLRALKGSINMEQFLQDHNIPLSNVNSYLLKLYGIQGTYFSGYIVYGQMQEILIEIEALLGSGTEVEVPLKAVYNQTGSWEFILVPMGTTEYIGFTGNSSLQFNVLTQDVYYGDKVSPSEEERKLQCMDIHIPENLAENESVPAVITIHGGGWCGGQKEDYDYMTGFITKSLEEDDCNCVHVNMNYRLTTGDPSENSITYVQMLEDIQSAIAYLQAHAAIYHIDPNKIALMGYSAGGHLALLYAYKAAKCAGCTYNDICPNVNLPEDVYCDKHKVSPAIPIELVISEAGPTNFVEWNNNGQLILPDANVCAMAGTTINDPDLITKLTNASPLTYVTSSAPYTILAYGNLYDEYYNLSGTDGVVPFFQSTVICDILGINNCTRFEFINIGHTDFGKAVHYDMSEEAFNQRRDEYLETVSCDNHTPFSDTCSACQQKRNTESNRYEYIWYYQKSNIDDYYDAIKDNL